MARETIDGEHAASAAAFELPPRQDRAWVGGPTLSVLDPLSIKTVTPVYGGGAQAGQIDAHEPVRATSVAAQVRAWWRVLEAPQHRDANALRAAEGRLFGGVHLRDERGVERAGRSGVRVAVTHVADQKEDRTVVDGKGMYALWPARLPDESETWRTRWSPGLTFTLHVAAPDRDRQSVERARRAFLLFGGYGGRTRRGCGTLWAPGATWWPREPTRAAFEGALEWPLGALSDTSAPARDVPSLRGCRLAVGQPTDGAEEAWATALGWLRDFRQQPDRSAGSDADCAREPERPDEHGRMKPGRSRWPEPDKIRQLGAYHDRRHTPRYGPEPAWPRASLGLPIVFSAWQGRSHKPLQLLWQRAGDNALCERLASALIVKALPLSERTYVPLALWLRRAEPAGGQVVLCDGNQVVARSAAPFGRRLGAGDQALYQPLHELSTLQDAFFAWLGRRDGVVLV